MVEKIMQDNQMYLTEWMRYNPSLQEVLRLDGNFLCYKDQERLDISQIYLPEILYNEPFRNDLANPEEMNGYDFFQIIKIYSQTNEILEKEKKEALKYPVIQDMTILKDEQGVEFIVFADIYGKKYRYVTKEPHKILELYQNLKNEKGNITIKDLGSVIQYANQKRNERSYKPATAIKRDRKRKCKTARRIYSERDLLFEIYSSGNPRNCWRL